MNPLRSWGNYPKIDHSPLYLDWIQSDRPPFDASKTALPYGLGRSYGDSCLNEANTILVTQHCNRIIAFDETTGLLRAEAGMSLADVLHFAVPRGWFPPVTPGTKFVTLGGALANDIHGKNHHAAGTFGDFVTQFELLRSEGSRKIVSRNANADWFNATVGGLGLTGLVTWVELQLKKVNGPYIDQEAIRFNTLEDFFKLSQDSEKDYEYLVSWIDCLQKGKKLGRGIFYRGNHSTKVGHTFANVGRTFSVPCHAPSGLLNRQSIGLFNFFYYWKQFRRSSKATIHYDPFFYPLDSLRQWNRIYGKRGFLQYQFVVPAEGGKVVEILERIARSGNASFLSVMKIFGNKKAPGMLSFPRPGITVALDFPNVGEKPFTLLDELDPIVVSAGGAVYPAKDARMSEATFKACFPEWKAFQKFIDPKFSSSFARRVKLCP